MGPETKVLGEAEEKPEEGHRPGRGAVGGGTLQAHSRLCHPLLSNLQSFPLTVPSGSQRQGILGNRVHRLKLWTKGKSEMM